jgi:hypothetical protein
MQKTVQVLERVRARVASGWCQRAWARDEDGNPLQEESNPLACRWCLGGALALEGNDVSGDSACALLERLIRDRHEADTIVGYNDRHGRTKEDVLQLIDQALAFARMRARYQP